MSDLIEKAVERLVGACFSEAESEVRRDGEDMQAFYDETHAARAALMDAIRAEIAKVREGINPNKVLCDDCPARWPVSLPAADARAGWATIESAPKDGTPVLCWRTRLYFGRWCSTNREWLDHATGYAVSREPTHWYDIPPPPRTDR